jgi:hypothetical protein
MEADFLRKKRDYLPNGLGGVLLSNVNKINHLKNKSQRRDSLLLFFFLLNFCTASFLIRTKNYSKKNMKQLTALSCSNYLQVAICITMLALKQ